MNKSNQNFLLKLVLSLSILFSYANTVLAQGIKFYQKESWEEIKAIAAKENKLIFIDVYTDWCGPCKLMEEEVFSLRNIADFYNQNFVNYKFDAEKGEGITLKERFGVQLYPTYLFVDPVRDEVVHKSTSRQDPHVFLFTGQSALSPETRSGVMEAQYLAGNRDVTLLRNYAKYLKSCYRTDELNKLVSEYLQAQPGLDDALAWEFFVSYDNGTASPAFKQLLAKQDELRTLYGAEAVDQKLMSAFEFDFNRTVMMGIYNPDRYDANAYQTVVERFNSVEFEGKNIVAAKAQVLDFLRTKKYDQAAELADRFPEVVDSDQSQILSFYHTLYFPSRSIEDISWTKHALKYVRYIAMNDLDNRSKAINHYNYALFLERYLTLCNAQNQVPDTEFLKEPTHGESRYTLRPPDLKMKPQR